MIELEKFKQMFNDMYDKPEASLCDRCKYAYTIEGGSVSIGMDGHIKTYLQRYCPYPAPGQNKGGRAIHTSGYAECEYFLESNSEKV